MRSALASLLSFTVCLAAGPVLAEEAPARGTRLLVLDLESEGVPPEALEVLDGLLEEGLRGREGVLVITSDDVRTRAPLEADRLAGCREELCLFELADVVDASFVLFSDATRAESGLALELGVFEKKRNEVVARERIGGESATGLAPLVRPALDRVLAPVTAASVPSVLESPLFLSGTAMLVAGGAVALGAGGYALELEYTLATPEVHRDEKERALEQGPLALWAAAGASAVAVVGAALMALALAVE